MMVSVTDDQLYDYVYMLLNKRMSWYWEDVGRVTFFFGSLWTKPKARSINFQKRQIRTEQASSIKDLLLWLFANLRKAKRISIFKRTLQRRTEGTKVV